MEQKPVLGSFMLEVANAGSETVAKLSRFGKSTNLTELSCCIALCSMHLSNIAKSIQDNEQYFKASFEPRFAKVMELCKEKFDLIDAGIDKAKEWKPETKDDDDDDDEPPKKLSAWKRLAWALDMNDEKTWRFDIAEFLDIENALTGILTLQYAVSLVILQKHAQVRKLTLTEITELKRLKKKTGWFLDMLRTFGMGKVMAFGLYGTDRRTVNDLLIDGPKKNQETIDSESVTLCGASDIDRPSSPALNKPEPQPQPEVRVETPVWKDHVTTTYEMWRISEGGKIAKTQSKNIRLLGIPIPYKMASEEIVDAVLSTKMPLSEEELTKLLAEKEVKTTDENTTLDMLADVSEGVHSIICQLVNDHNNNARRNDNNRNIKWSLKGISPALEPKPKRSAWPWGRKDVRPSYWVSHAKWIVILECVQKQKIFVPPPPPPPPKNWPGDIVVIDNGKKEKKKIKSGTQIQLSQQETEDVINDFLASVSNLYDGVLLEDRSAVLQSVELPSDFEDDSDDESDGRSSYGSSSLPDD